MLAVASENARGQHASVLPNIPADCILMDYTTWRKVDYVWKTKLYTVYCLLTILTSSIAEKLLTKRLTLTMVPASARKKEKKA